MGFNSGFQGLIKLATVFCCSNVASDVMVTVIITTIIIITIVFLETALFCFITQCCLMVGNDSFEELSTSTFRVVEEIVGSRKMVANYFCLAYLEMKTASPCVTSMTNCQSTRRLIPKKYILYQQC